MYSKWHYVMKIGAIALVREIEASERRKALARCRMHGGQAPVAMPGDAL